MFSWRVQLLDRGGNLEETVVSGLTLRRAIDAAGCDINYIVNAERCVYFGWRAVRISRHKQMVFLMKLLPHYLSGVPHRAAQLFTAYEPIHKLCKRCPAALDINLSLSERLEFLHFNPIAVTVIRAGEKSGEIATVLKQAISNLQREMQMHNKAYKGIVSGLLLFVISVVVLLGVSAGTMDALDSIVAAGVIEKRNTASLILAALGTYTRDYLWSLFLIVALGAVVVMKYDDRLMRVWPLSIFRVYLNVLRSIRLVSVWLILEQSGLSVEHDEQLLAAAIGEKYAMQISKQREKGETFSDLLNSRYFSTTLAECCVDISALSVANRISLLQQIVQLLDMEREHLASTMSNTFYTIGMLITLLAVALVLGGVLLPIYSSGLGGIQF